MIFAKQIEKVYKSRMFTRYDENGTVFYFSSEDFKGLNKEPYSFKTVAGNRLQGYFYFYDNPVEGRVVVFDHGMGGGHRAYMREIEKLARKGYLVFAYDHTGCMESEGESTNGFAQSICDLDNALSALKSDEKFAGMKFSVIGHSWGALSCQNIGAFHPDAAHIIALSGPVSVRHMLEQSFKGIMKGYREHIYSIERKANSKHAESNAAESLKNIDAKVLIIHSADDKVVAGKHHFEVLKSALSGRDNIRFLLVDGKGHNPNYTADAVKYMGEFFAVQTKMLKKGELSTDEQKKNFVDSFDWYRMTEQDDTVWAEIFKTLEE